LGEPVAVCKKNNAASFESEKKFIEKDAFIKIFGNHDLAWSTDLTTGLEMERIYDRKISVYEGLILQSKINGRLFSIFSLMGTRATHKAMATGSANFFVAHIWAPLQAFLKVNPNTPAYNTTKKTLHNRIMYEWSTKQKSTILITGHTHQPVFESLTHLERLYRSLLQAEEEKNAGKIEEIKKEIRLRNHSLPLSLPIILK
jgi:predicted phosphodiesterase